MKRWNILTDKGLTQAERLMSQFYHMGQPPVAARAGRFRAANRERLQRLKTIREDKTRADNGHVPSTRYKGHRSYLRCARVVL